jgi:hypothetical protein
MKKSDSISHSIPGQTFDHTLVLMVNESTISLSKLSKDDLKRIKKWSENDDLEYEIFPAFDCGPGPNGPHLFDCCHLMGLSSDLVQSDGVETTYQDQCYYVETIEKYCNSKLLITCTLAKDIEFDPSKIILKCHTRYTNIVTEIDYPNANVSWRLESEFDIDEREWNFYKCNNDDLEWIHIEDEISIIVSNS